MKQLKDILVLPNTNILRAIEALDSGALQILLVVDNKGKLLGSVTDGDIRRSILKGGELTAPVSAVMNNRPLSVISGTSREVVLSLMQKNYIHCIPVVDKQGCVVGLETETRLLRQGIEDTWVVSL